MNGCVFAFCGEGAISSVGDYFLNYPVVVFVDLWMKKCVIKEMAAIKFVFKLNHWYSYEIRQFKSYLRLPSNGGYHQHKTPKLVAFSNILYT